jgi:hypothetical protein
MRHVPAYYGSTKYYSCKYYSTVAACAVLLPGRLAAALLLRTSSAAPRWSLERVRHRPRIIRIQPPALFLTAA